MKHRVAFLLVFMALPLIPAASQEIVSDYTFSMADDLKKWQTVASKSIPESAERANDYRLVTEDGVPFLRTRTAFGLFARLKKNIVVGDDTSRIEVSVLMRKPACSGAVSAFALTSREKPTGGVSFFKAARDSGFGMNGYQQAYQSANNVYWRKDGEDFVLYSPLEPYRFLATETAEKGLWYRWMLVYDNQKKTLSFSRDGETVPYAVQHNVDLSGVILCSVVISAEGHEYRRITVTHTMSRKE